jgi:hypothetical protein
MLLAFSALFLCLSSFPCSSSFHSSNTTSQPRTLFRFPTNNFTCARFRFSRSSLALLRAPALVRVTHIILTFNRNIIGKHIKSLDHYLLLKVHRNLLLISALCAAMRSLLYLITPDQCEGVVWTSLLWAIARGLLQYAAWAFIPTLLLQSSAGVKAIRYAILIALPWGLLSIPLFFANFLNPKSVTASYGLSCVRANFADSHTKHGSPPISVQLWVSAFSLHTRSWGIVFVLAIVSCCLISRFACCSMEW